jgi:hypothetical protein
VDASQRNSAPDDELLRQWSSGARSPSARDAPGSVPALATDAACPRRRRRGQRPVTTTAAGVPTAAAKAAGDAVGMNG